MTIATTIEARSTSSPDEVRKFADKGQANVIQLAGRDVICGMFEPGWRWSEHIKPIAQTESCEAVHFGYCQQGRMTVRMDDGTEATMGPGDVVAIPAGHDAWVEGDETCIFVDFGEISDYAKSQ